LAAFIGGYAKKFKNRDSGLTPKELKLLFLVSLLSLACFASLRTLREILECFFGFEVIRRYPLGPQLGPFIPVKLCRLPV
jgi:hypothetical protein